MNPYRCQNLIFGIPIRHKITIYPGSHLQTAGFPINLYIHGYHLIWIFPCNLKLCHALPGLHAESGNTVATFFQTIPYV